MKKIRFAATFGIFCLALNAGDAFADLGTPSKAVSVARQPSAKKDIFTLLDKAGISLDDAVKAAEKTVFGKPVRAVLDNGSNPLAYQVALADRDTRTITFISVDAGTGKVLSSRVIHPGRKGKLRRNVRDYPGH